MGIAGAFSFHSNTPLLHHSHFNLMPSFLFWLFAIVMLVFGAAVVINRNPIASALSLVVCFLGLSALFMSLDAFFIGIIQVLVYAGAVMVLFLFIIMLLDLRAEERRKLNWIAFGGGFLVAFSLLVQILAVIGSTRMAKQTFPPLASPQTDDVRSVGLVLFGNYNLPFSGNRRADSCRDHRRHSFEQTPIAMTTLGDYLTVSGVLFAIGFSGVLLRRNVIIIFMALELMLNAANLSLVAFFPFSSRRRWPAQLQRAGLGFLYHYRCRRRSRGRSSL